LKEKIMFTLRSLNESTFVLVAASLAASSCGYENSPGKNLRGHELAKVTAIVTPTLGMTLGRGYDPTRPLEPKGDCVGNVAQPTMESWKDAKGIEGVFTETRVTSWEQMQRELSISANVAAESMWGNASASFSKFEKFRSDEESFTWLMKFVVETGEKTLNGSQLTLTPQAKALVDAGRMQDFYKMCGTEYVRSVKMGGRLLVANEVSSKFSEIVNWGIG
jgi:hypothetical protein